MPLTVSSLIIQTLSDPDGIVKVLAPPKVPDSFKQKLKEIRKPGIYLYLETTQSGNTTLRLKTNDNYGNLDKSFPPNYESIAIIKRLIK